MRGIFTIEIIDNDRHTINWYPNLVVSTGRKLVHRLLTGEDNPITSLGVGSSATAVDTSQTSLVSDLGTKNIGSWTMGIDDIVFETTFNYNEGNGTIREMAIFARDGTMFARAICPDKTKTSSQIMKLRYKIHLEDV